MKGEVYKWMGVDGNNWKQIEVDGGKGRWLEMRADSVVQVLGSKLQEDLNIKIYEIVGFVQWDLYFAVEYWLKRLRLRCNKIFFSIQQRLVWDDNKVNIWIQID